MSAAAQRLHDVMEAALVPLDKECQRLAGEHCIQVSERANHLMPRTTVPSDVACATVTVAFSMTASTRALRLPLTRRSAKRWWMRTRR